MSVPAQITLIICITLITLMALSFIADAYNQRRNAKEFAELIDEFERERIREEKKKNLEKIEKYKGQPLDGSFNDYEED